VPRVSAFRALRYDEAVAGPLYTLVAPPYDVLDDEARRLYLGRSPYNVVHLTLPDSADAAERALDDWRATGVLREEEPALWWIAEDYVDEHGDERTSEGLAAVIEATPYEDRQVLPHERTHAGPKEGRLRLLRATRTQLEPIFLFYDAEPVAERPPGPPAVRVESGFIRTSAWRLPAADLELGVPLVIADGHHRYETAVAFRREEPSATHTLAVLFSARAPGFEILPTHRIVPQLSAQPPAEPADDWDEKSLGLYRAGRYFRVESDDELDTRAVEQYAHNGVRYTHVAWQAVEAVDRGEAEAAFLVRPPTVEQITAFAARGETMPQKSTFFYPKLTSGLLFFPL
jgi:uncharacterized protein (DUF1015 family)